MSIQILPRDVVDQIAAGEVVERPAHLLKELLENSFDAGAKNLSIEFSQGGRFAIVKDDGCGISAEQMNLALERFSTSKIRKSDDLWTLSSYGFRGEALASISAVSRLTMTSRTANSDSAYQVISNFGEKSEPKKVGGDLGTTILIEDLFGNVPARLKFLKSDGAEHLQIKTMLKALALSHPQVQFRVIENGELLYYWPSQETIQQRISQVLELQPIYVAEKSDPDTKVQVYFASPEVVHKTSKNIWLFAQGRWIQDRMLQTAVMEAYRSLLMHGEYPAALVWLQTEPDRIDVNIHPTKSQVKFEDSSKIFKLIHGALRSAIEKAPWVGSQAKGFQLQQKNNFTSSSATQDPSAAFSNPANMSFRDAAFSTTQFQSKPSPVTLQSLQMLKEERETYSSQRTEIQSEKPVGFWGSLQVLGQADLTYIVCQSATELILVDQHAAHERVAFEKLMNAWRGGQIERQDYLFPYAIDLGSEKSQLLEPHFEEFSRLGFLLERLGPETVGIKSGPALVKESSLGPVLDLVANEIMDQGQSFSIEKIVMDLCATMACHSVVRAGQSLSLQQMQNLLAEMDEFPLSGYCPHGRTVSLKFSFTQLEKDFGRTQ